MKFLGRRLAFYLLTAWAAVTINFFIPRVMKGDPVQSLINRYQGQISTEAEHSLYVLFGLDTQESLWQQYVDYWGEILHGNFGISFTSFPTPVTEVIGDSLPWTLGLVGVATVIAVVGGSLVGILIGWRRGTWMDAILPVTTFFSSVPYFWLGLIAISVFAIWWPVLPLGGAYDGGLIPGWSWEFVSSVLEHAILPGLTIVLASISGWILGMRNMMVTVTSEDYVTVAHAKGLSERRVMFGYAARNAILPQVSGFALSLGFVVSGTLVMEMVFSYPGIGLQLFNAIGGKDYPLMQGIFLIITLAVLVANVLADVAYVLLDPRTRQEA
ncbi:peptide/nickel transport system permease protein [Sediminihabitans luteus]|uniref:Peptide/nickel transport system permease protein n=1 Tax=Sediminihabitans luteus TaxID=1138585 RepID=A0A2M9D003_9CELL|nr:ABC transporter permease [Sediminihabitans luteus]PJJ77522.1 peptide/nickel transport system permease protein [Sediminihabitans luteus]GII98421.1 peptide ABC transporter permease [Sediminihabitans luteus]